MSSIKLSIQSLLKKTWLGNYYRNKKWNNNLLSAEKAEKAVEKYMPHLPADKKEELICDIIETARKYRFDQEEFFHYKFYNKTEDERKLFISDVNRIKFCEIINKSSRFSIFDDKLKTYEIFGRFYKRDVCGIKSKKDIKLLHEFIKKHEKFILKPFFSSGGKGIRLIDLSETDDKEKAVSILINEYFSQSKFGFVCEEVIVQADELAKFHPSSVNTLRVATVCYDEGPEIIAALFRVGSNNAFVDNTCSGGLFGTIDLETGTINAITDGEGNHFTSHPLTGVRMLGYEIPKWEEAKAFAKELAETLKDVRFVGWDIALTKNGWVMVEGNSRAQFGWQLPPEKGFLPECNKILKRLNRPEMTDLSIH